MDDRVTMAVERRVFHEGVHVATSLSSVGEKSDRGPFLAISPVYGHGDDWEREATLVAFYEQSYRGRNGVPAPRRSLEEWRQSTD